MKAAQQIAHPVVKIHINIQLQRRKSS